MPTENFTAKFKVDVSDLKKGITEANNAIKRANAEFKNATAGMTNWSTSVAGVTAKIEQQQKIVEQERAKLELLRQQQDRLTQAQQEGQQIINTLNQKYQQAVSTYGEASEEAKNYAQQLAQAQAAQERNAQAAENLETRIINQDTAVRNAEAQVSQYQQSLSQLQQAEQEAATHTETLSEKVERQQGELDALKERYVEVVATQGETSQEAQALGGQIDTLSGELQQNQTALSDAQAAADNLDHTLEDTGDTADDTANGGIQALSVAVGNFITDVIENAIQKIGEFITKTAQIGMSYEAQMSKVQAISGTVADDTLPSLIETAEGMGLAFSEGSDATETAMNILDAKAQALGATTKFSASEVAQAFEYMAMAGWSVEDMLNGIDGILNLAAASGADLATTSDIVTDGLTAMGYTAADAGRLADVMAAASSSANTNVEMMGETFKYVAPVAGALGFSMEDTALATGLMANSGVKASQAGTALRSTFSRLTKPTEAMLGVMGALGLTTEEYGTVINEGAIQDAQAEVAEKTDALAAAQDNYNATLDQYSNQNAVELREAFAKLNKAQVAMAEANEKYGEGSLEAFEAQTKLLKAQENWDETMQLYSGETSPKVQEALQKVQEAQADLATAQENLSDAQEGSIEMTGLQTNLLTDSEGNMRSLKDVLKELRTAFSGLDEEQQASFASTLFGQEAMSGMLAIINASDEDFENLSEAIDGSTGSAEGMAETMQDNLEGDLTTLNSKLEAIQISLYNGISPALRKGAEMLGKFLDGISWLMEKIEPFTPLLFALGGAISFVLAMAAKGFVVAKVIPALTAGFTKLWAIMAANPVGLVISAIAGLVAGIMYLWKNSESFRNFWLGVWEGIKEAWASFQDAFQIGMDILAEKWAEIKEKASEIWTAVTEFFAGAWDAVKDTLYGIATWIYENVYQPIVEFFRPIVEFFMQLVEVIVQLAIGAWNVIKAVWSVVSAWMNEHIIQPVKNFFVGLWTGIKDGAITAWNGIKSVFSLVASWFNQHIIQPVQNFFHAMWDVLKTGASNAWEGIKSVFSVVSSWFEEKFSKAWEAVKGVFSTGGKVFDGIKEGITDAFKTVVNAIIRGVNKVVAIPFNAINNMLDKLRDVEILGIQPFSGLITRLDVPQIPELAKGGIVKNRSFIAGEDGAEAVIPLEKNTNGIKQIAQTIASYIPAPDISGLADVISGMSDMITGSGDTVNNYNFVQNNSSPKALSRWEIYRQTRNLIQTAKEV